MTKIPALILTLALPLAAHARGGDMDTTVSPTGVVPFLATLNDTAFVFARQPDGKFVVVHNDANSVTLQRIRVDGTPDPAFGIAGAITYPRAVPRGSPSPAIPLAVKAVMIAPDGKVLLAGEAIASCGTVGIARLLADGSADNAFGTNGWSAPLTSTTGVNICNDGAQFRIGALRFLPDGRIAVVAYPLSGASGAETGTAIAGRWLADGTPDATFGTEGFMRPLFQWLGHPGGARIRDDGAFELVHAQQVPGNTPWALVSTRLAAAGASRTDATLAVPEDLRATPGVAFPADGSRLLWSRSSGAAGEVSVARVKADDTFDNGFGTGGRLRIAMAPGLTTIDVLPTPDGGAVLVASALAPPNDALQMAKVDAAGVLEPSFGTNGRLAFSTSALSEFPWQLSMRADGYLELFGYSVSRFTVDQRYNWYFARLQAVPDIVEFENLALGHYFIAYDNAEARGIDAGAAGPGWRRTSLGFRPGGDTLVCRFYGTPGRGPNSHFYSADPKECEAVKMDPGWTYEGTGFSVTRTKDGLCPAGLEPVYRFYNNRFAQNDSNHRFLVDPAFYVAMQDRGWTAEGIGWCVRR